MYLIITIITIIISIIISIIITIILILSSLTIMIIHHHQVRKKEDIDAIDNVRVKLHTTSFLLVKLFTQR